MTGMWSWEGGRGKRRRGAGKREAAVKRDPDPFQLQNVETLTSAMRMFADMGLVERFNVRPAHSVDRRGLTYLISDPKSQPCKIRAGRQELVGAFSHPPTIM